MKKLATLLLAAGLVFGAATGASAIDFKAKGNWTMSFDYGSGANLVSKDRAGNSVAGYGTRGNNAGSADNFNASQRLRLQLDAVASESLSGTVYFEIGTAIWGKAANGAALGADGTVVKVKNAYLDWIVPNTDLKVRMGLQGIALPSFSTGGSMIFDDDVAGIALSNKFTDNVSATFFWARPYNDNYTGANSNAPANYMDNADLFALLVPLTFDGVKVTPWVMVGAFGPNALSNGGGTNWSGSAGNYFGHYNNFSGGVGGSYNNAVMGMNPAVAALKNGKSYRPTQYTMPVWAGLTGEVTAWDPFRLAWDLNYGDNSAQYQELRRAGWFGSLLAEYKLDWATPGLYFWYGSGDDGNVKNGSERMAILRPNGTNQFSPYAGTGAPQEVRDGVLGNEFTGTWGIGARLKDMSFLEGLKHTFSINYFNGTNSPSMAKYILGTGGTPGRTYSNLYTDFNTGGGTNNDLYLTTKDSALEFNLVNTYKIYDNLTLYTQASYLALFLDQSRKMWGNNGAHRGVSQTDAWNIDVTFMYDF